MIQENVEEGHASATARNNGGKCCGLYSSEPSPGHFTNIPRLPSGHGGPWPPVSSPPACAQVLIVASSSPHPDPQREIGLMACVNGTSSGCTRSGLST